VRIYVDTSVFGAYFEPGVDVPTRRLFEMFARGEARLVLSELTLDELRGAPRHVRELPETLPPEHVERIGQRLEAAPLAELYIEEGIMRPSMYFDALHIALAVMARVDVLVSWNFRDFVNEQKIRGYNTINARLGYPAIDIRQPGKVISYGR
jgi:predicted nucleic acid-binding protein